MYNGPLLAPMVRASFTGMRRIADKLGATCVHTDVVVASNIVQASIFESENGVVFVRNVQRVLHLEKDLMHKTIIQLAGNDPVVLSEACKKLQPYCAGLDLNVGCAKEWTQGCMGVALLQQPQLLLKVVTMMVASSEKPISVKIRLLDTPQQTASLIQDLFQVGISRVTIHMRQATEDREKHCARFMDFIDVIRFVSPENSSRIAANGGILCIDDYKQFVSLCKAENIPVPPVMLARGALRYPLLFEQIRAEMGDPIVQNDLKTTNDVIQFFVNTARVNETQFILKDKGEGGPESIPLDFMKKYRFQEVRTVVLFMMDQQKLLAADLKKDEIQRIVQKTANGVSFEDIEAALKKE
ncbi:tRNA-dihydrouridine_synthase [Hexamita inflata]|uniref:tRNA-dihydrouridine_synthase n=1 Tax=Hexamita inflata TaxID=28002 RepID=A0ABP1H8B0_9EUKA